MSPDELIDRINQPEDPLDAIQEALTDIYRKGRTPTGRLVMPDLITRGAVTNSLPHYSATARWGDTDPKAAEEIAKSIQEAFQEWAETVPVKDGRRYIILEGDYSAIERHVLASMMHETALDIELSPLGGSMPGFDLFKPIYREPEPEDKPMKQNGRSAAYLKHDRTTWRRGRGLG